MRALILSILVIVLLVLSSGSMSVALLVGHSWLQNAPALICLALAAGIVLACGSLDIASGAVFGLAGMIVLFVANVAPNAMIIAVTSAILAVITLYAAVGVLCYRFRVPPLLCTLAVGFCAKAAAVLIYSHLKGVGVFAVSTGGPASRLVLSPGQFIVGFSSTTFNICCIIAILVALCLWRYRTTWGIQHIAVGMDSSAARMAGIRVEAIRTRAFILAGCLVALASQFFLFDASRGGWSPDVGWGRELIAIAAAVVGGARISGGKFEPIAIAVAAVALYAIRDVIDSFGWPSDFSLMLVGGALIAIGLMDSPHIGARKLSRQSTKQFANHHK
ncbi:MAG: ABC transporter permease subunit [Phycisphaerales bacterium]